MATNTVSSNAKRPKNAWYLFSTKVGDNFEIGLGYKNTRGESAPYSASKQNLSVKIPFGPPTKCEYNLRKDDKGDIVKEFCFKNCRRESVGFDEVLLNNLEREVNPFSQRITNLFVSGQKKLLAYFVSATQCSEGFVYHSERYDDDGLCNGAENVNLYDRSSVTLDEIVGNGGSLSELREFITFSKEYATFGDSRKEAIAEVFKSSDPSRKRKSDVDESKPPKVSKKAALDINEKSELEDPEGLEKKYQSLFISVVWIPLNNVFLSKSLNIKPNIYRVCKIVESMKYQYDPSQAVLVVAPEDDTEKIDLNNPGTEQTFVVVQKIHTFCAYKELDKCGQFEKMSGHKERKVLCFVVNTSIVALMRYGNIRANDISQKFARKTYPQDLLHVYETLVLKDSTVNCMKVIERMTKLGRVGPNEATSLRKICKWSLPAFRCLMEVVKTFEAYETLDVKSSGNAGNISRGEKHCMTNAVFNNLGKVEESYFKENYHQVLSKKISLKTLVDGNIKIKEVEKVYGALGQISGFQTV